MNPWYDDETNPPKKELKFHLEAQDTNCEAWQRLEALIQKAAANKAREFAPRNEMTPEMWRQIITLPPSIANLKSVRRVELYGSHLVRVPPEIGDMDNLERLEVYTSYRLHWLPYEITRCPKFKGTCISIRALYGNDKYRPPFPKLGGKVEIGSTNCSVCRGPVIPGSLLQVWISLQFGADVVPLLVNACSQACINKLPSPARDSVDHPHQGGLDLKQPPTKYEQWSKKA